MYRVTLLVLVLLGLTPVAQATRFPPLPSRNPIVPAIWVEYTQRVVKELFPTRPKLWEKKLIVVPSDEIRAAPFEKEVRISTRFIREIQDEEEYAVLIAHEWGHGLWGSINKPQTKVILPTSEFFDDYRVKEAEADFVAFIVTGSSKYAQALLERTLQWEKRGNLSLFEFREFQKILRFRLQITHNMPDTLARVVQAEQIPNPLPKWDAIDAVWQDYTRRVLFAMYPNYKVSVKDLFVNIVESDEVAEGGVQNHLPFVSLNPRLLRFIVKTPEEFAVLIGHEFGHSVVTRDYQMDYLETDVTFPILETGFRKQYEADMFGILPLERGACLWADTLDRIVLYYLQTERGYNPKLDRARTSRLRKMCDESK